MNDTCCECGIRVGDFACVMCIEAKDAKLAAANQAREIERDALGVVQRRLSAVIAERDEAIARAERAEERLRMPAYERLRAALAPIAAPGASEAVALTPEQFEHVVDMIENPRPPTQALVDLLRKEKP
jgi:uncharacterized protein (DUF885 family)